MKIKTIKKFLIALIIFFPVITPAMAADEWDSADKGLLATLVLSKTIDCLQTRYIFDKPGWHESNPIINHGVEKYGKEYIPIYFLTTTLISSLVANYLPPAIRKVWLGLWIAGSLKCVHHNYSVGIKLKF